MNNWTYETRFPERKLGYRHLHVIEESPWERDTHQEIVACRECKALVLRDDKVDHSDWHDRQADEAMTAGFPSRYVVLRDGLDARLICDECWNDASTGESGLLRDVENRDELASLAAAVLAHEQEVHR